MNDNDNLSQNIYFVSPTTCLRSLVTYSSRHFIVIHRRCHLFSMYKINLAANNLKWNTGSRFMEQKKENKRIENFIRRGVGAARCIVIVAVLTAEGHRGVRAGRGRREGGSRDRLGSKGSQLAAQEWPASQTGPVLSACCSSLDGLGWMWSDLWLH